MHKEIKKAQKGHWGITEVPSAESLLPSQVLGGTKSLGY